MSGVVKHLWGTANCWLKRISATGALRLLGRIVRLKQVVRVIGGAESERRRYFPFRRTQSPLAIMLEAVAQYPVIAWRRL